MHELGFTVRRVKSWKLSLSLHISSMGFARLAESTIRSVKGKGENEKLSALEKIFSSTIGGALATWNQPIEVVRVEVRVDATPYTLKFSILH